jgi:hypothetical protein
MAAKATYRIKPKKARTVKQRAATYAPRARRSPRPSARAHPRAVVPLGPHDWDKYRGETIAFEDGRILAHGQDLDQVLQEVWKRYGKRPNEVNLLKVARRRI